MVLGSATFSPSLALFGGNSRNREGLSQALTVNNGETATYQSATTLRWTDYGARAGLDARFPFPGAWVLDAGGWVGVARRDIRLNGSDNGSVDPAGAVFFAGASSISAGDDRAVFLANAEAGLSYKLNPNFTIRAFGGLNHDNKVPGISAPTFTGSVATAGRGSAAGIAYSSETSYYAGGGLVVTFGGVR